MLFQNEVYSTKRIGVLPQRAYYIPFAISDVPQIKSGVTVAESSSLYTSLNGTWSFTTHESLDEITDINEPLTKTIPVPSCVQTQGYDKVQYINTRYPFPFDPPFVPRKNPTFHYRRTVEITSLDCEYDIVFDGVDSCFYLFINGKKVGFSQISHAVSEFDVTPYLHTGTNTVDVVVVKWCASSYLECQDKFRFTGIFRNVYLLRRSKQHITDYKVTTDIVNGQGVVQVINNSEVAFDVEFIGKTASVEPNCKHGFIVENPSLWTAETPNLYQMEITACGEKIIQQVAIRTVKIVDGIFTVNGKHIKLKGVNRHESNPVTGATVTVADTEQDLQLIKSVGANAIRTSHYPDIPQFYELCNYYGVYVLDEADVETHGAACYTNGYDLALWKKLADSDLFVQAVTDRQVALYQRDKNFGCVIIWSLGNESSFGRMFYDGADYLREHDDRPIHYEGIVNLPDKGNDPDYYSSRIDICSHMYASPYEMQQYLLDEKETRPYLLCEYSHAMGNSNGDLADYWQVINSNDRFFGAFVWEWCDHAVLVDGKLHYGGDSGEADHDGNFCVDGLVTPFRKFKPNTMELSACYHGKIAPSSLVNKCQPLAKLPCDNPLQVKFNRNNAGIDEIIVNGRNVLCEPLRLQFTRAFIDNDRYDRPLWQAIREASIDVRSVTTKGNKTTFVGKLVRDCWSPFAEVTICYTVYDSAIDVDFAYVTGEDFRYLPRAGITFALDKSYNKFDFFGYGKGESYIDKRLATECGSYTLTVSENFANNLKPQECGSHYGTSYLTIGNLSVTAKKPFSFSVLPYSTNQLIDAPHDYDLPEQQFTHVNIDVGMSGIGTHSCGPELDEKYRLAKSDSNTFRLTFVK